MICPTLYSDNTNFIAVSGSRLTVVNRSEVGTNGLDFGTSELNKYYQESKRGGPHGSHGGLNLWIVTDFWASKWFQNQIQKSPSLFIIFLKTLKNFSRRFLKLLGENGSRIFQILVGGRVGF